MASCCQSHPGCPVPRRLATSPDNWAVPDDAAHVDSPSYEHTNIHATKHNLRQQIYLTIILYFNEYFT